jgi:hypothetical protein
MIGIRLAGKTPPGLSPIFPLLWLPAGLKYLIDIIFH